MDYYPAESMNDKLICLVQPLAYRVWDPKHRWFFYTDVQPEATEFLNRWTGLFDKQGCPLYEDDIVRAHYDWRFGWVRALVMRHPKRNQYYAQATAVDGTMLNIGCYSFADSYRLGNLREHPGKLVAATPQFPHPEAEPWWLSPAVFRPMRGPCFN
jgi:hypothetical protein